MKEPKKIFVVDDDKFNAALMKEVCENAGHLVVEINDSTQVVDLAVKESPDLILLDIMMSTKDGFQVCQELRSTDSTSKTPIILVTAVDNLDSKIRGIELGADDYITKPFRLFDLQARISSALNSRDGEPPPSAGKSDGQHQPLRLGGYRQLRRDMEYEFQRALRYQHPLCCCLLLVNEYEDIYNDRGKKEAAGLIAATVTVLQRFLRATDRIYRLEENTFIILMPETNLEQGKIPIARIVQELDKPQISTSGAVSISSSIVSFPDSDEKIDNYNDILRELSRSVATKGT